MVSTYTIVPWDITAYDTILRTTAMDAADTVGVIRLLDVDGKQYWSKTIPLLYDGTRYDGWLLFSVPTIEDMPLNDARAWDDGVYKGEIQMRIQGAEWTTLTLQAESESAISRYSSSNLQLSKIAVKSVELEVE